MKSLMLALAPALAVAMLVGCDVDRTTTARSDYANLKTYHDDAQAVTCWSKGGQTLSCLPDWMLTAPRQALGVKP
ncbi:hypothetical protein D3C81_1859350 [compost metagenome]